MTKFNFCLGATLLAAGTLLALAAVPARADIADATAGAVRSAVTDARDAVQRTRPSYQRSGRVVQHGVEYR